MISLVSSSESPPEVVEAGYTVGASSRAELECFSVECDGFAEIRDILSLLIPGLESCPKFSEVGCATGGLICIFRQKSVI